MTRPLYLRLPPALAREVRHEAGKDLRGWISDAIRDALDSGERPSTGQRRDDTIATRIDDDADAAAREAAKASDVTRAEWIRWAIERSLAALE